VIKFQQIHREKIQKNLFKILLHLKNFHNILLSSVSKALLLNTKKGNIEFLSKLGVLKEVWPNFFIVGTGKAGTTSLYEYLSKVPEIYMSPKKEPRYFSVSIEDPPIIPVREKQEYLDLFHNVVEEKIIGEASPSYICDPEAPKLIHKVSPKARILISLRDPVQRAYSAYFQQKRMGRTNSESFHQVLEKFMNNKKVRPLINRIFSNGLYYENIKRYLDIFGKDQVKIIFFEDLEKNTLTTMNEIVKYLGLNFVFENSDFEVHNPYVKSKNELITNTLRDHQGFTKILRKFIPSSTREKINKAMVVHEEKPKMDEKDRKTLIKFYTEDVIKVKKLLGKDLPWKNFKGLTRT